MKYFAIADIHGHYDEMIACLKEKGYDENNENHKLIIIGDMIDRGPKSKEVLEFAYRLKNEGKAIVILGNHDKFLLDFFDKNYERVTFNLERNGHNETFKSLIGKEIDESVFDEVNIELHNTYPHLYTFLQELPYYVELEDYVFVHGAIDTSLEDWRKDTVRNFTWNYQHKMDSLPGKTIVCGHVQAVYVRTDERPLDKLYEEKPELFDILHKEGVIFIDGSVVTTKKINVLEIEL